MQTAVLSVVYYRFPAYGNSITGEDMNQLQNIQNSAVRLIFTLKLFDRVSPFREAIKMLPIKAMCRLQTFCMIHKIIKFNEPHYFSDRRLFRGEVSQRSTRQDGKLQFPNVRLEVGRRASRIMGRICSTAFPYK